MKPYTLLFFAVVTLLFYSAKPDKRIKESSFAKSLVPGEYILPAEEGWWNWGMAPIYDEKGKLHVFMSTIPNEGSWIRDSKIVHFMADGPEGPIHLWIPHLQVPNSPITTHKYLKWEIPM